MVIKQLSDYGCEVKLREFIEDLFNNWKQESSFSQENICCPQRPINEIMEKVEAVDGNASEFIIAFDEKTESICGMLYITFNSDNSAHISLVNVSPKYRRMRVGFSLLSYSMILSAKKGIDCAMLETWNGNHRAIALFEKFGFTKTSADEKTIELKTNLPKILQQAFPDLKSLSLDYSILNDEVLQKILS
ncbi:MULTISPECIES: GNAT family N-acetyltransferase [Acetivibrio]|uniref:GNAT family N-acetyltransferase n=1 Tax=Acetivibrio TaxID=35829 RepID=UPI0022400E51|nr:MULTISPECIES: N-acetyltransferase [Acetivibrio]HOA81137.1 N-acetyltransferase [Defluviitaleaceae bacterium]HOM02666.1 N-acetyltransferase [Acetivibrio sp.]HOV25708.1 N-acetyltransferase [Pseudobacteroides sp.]